MRVFVRPFVWMYGVAACLVSLLRYDSDMRSIYGDNPNQRSDTERLMAAAVPSQVITTSGSW